MPQKKLIVIKQNKKEYKDEYSWHGRFGIRILWLLGVVGLELEDE